MVKFIVVRHGFSKSNEANKFTGQADIPLAELGHRQAEKTAEYIFENFKIDKIYSSDLSRAAETAQPIAEKFSLPVIADGKLREIDGGLWEQEPIDELYRKYPQDYDLWIRDIGIARCTGGENMQEVQTRTLAELTRIAEENDGKTIAVVTHAGVIRALQCFWEKRSLESMKEVPWVTNASVSTVEYENGEYRIGQIGSDSHLIGLNTNLPANI